jgi:hypothetical protein
VRRSRCRGRSRSGNRGGRVGIDLRRGVDLEIAVAVAVVSRVWLGVRVEQPRPSATAPAPVSSMNERRSIVMARGYGAASGSLNVAANAANAS